MHIIRLRTSTKVFALFFLVLFGALYLLCRPVHAATASYYTNSPLIDDSVYLNATSMSADQIQQFLAGKNSYLTNLSVTESSTTESLSYYPHYNQSVSVAQAIYDAAQVYGINPQVIMATMQKEESLITDPSPSNSQLKYAMGYGCPDSAGCSDAKAGLFYQIDNGTWDLRYLLERARGNNTWWNTHTYPCNGSNTTYYSPGLYPGNTVSFYDDNNPPTLSTRTPYVSFKIDNAATAAMYCYTPHAYPGSAQEYYSGSYNFVVAFTTWFGNTRGAPYYAAYYAQSPYPQLNPGQSASVYFEYQNIGNQIWYDDASISSAPAGSYPIHLATAHTLNRSSAFSATWPNPARAAVNFAAVYNADGTTLAANQHVAQPGQIVKFSFTMTAPTGLAAATYPEYFMPIAEGTDTGAFNDPGTAMLTTVNAAPGLSYKGQSGYPTVPAGTSSNAYALFTNTGSTPLYDDSSIASAPSGTYPLHLATSHALNRASDFSSDWPNSSRASNNFAAVYNADGTTLAANQHVAQPGQIVKFAFNFSAPNGYAAGTYQEYFQPILEGTSDGYFGDFGLSWTVTVPSSAVFTVTNNSQGLSLTSNQPGQLNLTLKNVGNASGNALSLRSTGDSDLASPSWQSSNVPQGISQGIDVNQSVTITVPILAPSTTSSTTATLNCAIASSGNNLPLTSPCNIPVAIAGASYSASTYSSPSPLQTVSGKVDTVVLMYKNSGNQPWYDDTSISSSDWRNAMPTHLATAHALNRLSGFSVNWPNPARAAVNFAAVYNADGTTLAANQHVAQPGQIVKFSFTVSPQAWVPAGYYAEYFQPIMEGSSDGKINDVGSHVDLSVAAPTFTAAYAGQSGYPRLKAGQSATVFFEYKNTGNQTWYDDASIGTAPVTTYPIHLGTSRQINRQSAFSATWPNTSRAANLFSAVYNTDGSLSDNQHVAKPGQIAKFSFTMTVPDGGLPSATYPEYFIPVAEGTPTGAFNDPGTAMLVTVY